jgi:hypothetical protein
MMGRAGDQWMTTFQCDVCHFRNIHKRDPSDRSPQDTSLLEFIRRANLDALWSRESSTVYKNAVQVRKIMEKAELLGLEEVMIPPRGPFPVEDECGMAMAAVMVLRSLDEGRNDDTIQFDTTRQFASAFSNLWHSSTSRSKETIAINRSAKYTTSNSPTNADWFGRFKLGMHKRVGDNHKPDLAVSIEVMLSLMHRFDVAWEQVRGNRGAEEEVLFPALFSIISYVAALRGEEVPLMDLAGTRAHYEEGIKHKKLPHVVAALLGRFKGETGELTHIMPLAVKTASGLDVQIWMKRMLDWYAAEGITNGPVFRDGAGKRARAGKYEWTIKSWLEVIQREEPDLIGASVDVFEDYGVSRSFRRGSDTQAINQQVSKADIDLNCRWRTIENARGRKPSMMMQQSYAEVRQLIKSLIRYSAAL